MSLSEHELILEHISYNAISAPEDIFPASRYRALAKDGSMEFAVVDIVDLQSSPSLKVLCDNLDKAVSIPECEGLIKFRDAFFLQSYFVVITKLPREAEIIQSMAGKLGESIWSLAAQLLRPLRYLHRNEFVHAAISPQTVYWDAQMPLLGELWWMHNSEGLPITRGASDDVTEQIPESILPFLAPEQLMGEPPSRESDIFSFGALLYFLLSGEQVRKMPVVSSAGELRMALAREPIFQLNERYREENPDICTVIDKLLLIDPSKRLNIFMLEAILNERIGAATTLI